ncbi:Gfo/Idh/MocA family protein [Tenggerimyces flavus]|uniref:Gfo/Idh/MocA family protein n=1 Tax=Tenggerimyces flavus TaxID=1708749 RepID=A0ABV7YEI8_9ACTN|nr:Gfo/Idh/MocA family oxidoreductase [Tenggerimyces flavus]MBM7786715.1 putative dehydrogenase [Tenggerimyces flavus]
MHEFRVAIIGCGAVGRIHAECLAKLDGARVVAFCDVVGAKALVLANEFGAEYATADSARILADESIDVVYVATQHDSHAELCVRALDAGKHVLVEKPLALNLEDCKAVAAAAERSTQRFMVAFKMRYFDMVEKARELVPEPLVVTMQMMDNPWPPDSWTNDPLRGGGNVLSQGCHSADLLRHLARQDPVEVYAVGGNYYQPSGVTDNVTAVFRFDGGVSASLVQGDASRPPVVGKMFLQLFARDRSVTLTDRLTTLTFAELGRPAQVFHGSETGYLEENRAFLRALRDGTDPPTGYRDGLYATAMMLQAVASTRSGRAESVEALVSGWQNSPVGGRT